MKDVATKYDLERYIRFSHRVQSAKWDEDEGVWKLTISTPDGGTITDQCEILANGTGVLKSVLPYSVDPLLAGGSDC